MKKNIVILSLISLLQATTVRASQAPPWASVAWNERVYKTTLLPPIGSVEVHVRGETLGMGLQEISIRYLGNQYLIPSERLKSISLLDKPEITIPANNFIDQEIPLEKFTVSFEYGGTQTSVDNSVCKVYSKKQFTIELGEDGVTDIKGLP
uniref:Cellulose synthase regulatory subunit n=1 Tax=uncultured Thiotrichaceae bacterium TaxID=298394 RepID=A0A6S6UIS3_9GAMM|nr:MAG: Unknown protein [uncultured Thiotrichaceae bacterium]